MIVREVGPEEKEDWNNFVSAQEFGHVIQSWEWGEFKKTVGTPPVRIGVFREKQLVASAQYTLHPVPYTKKFIGFLPKGPILSTLEPLPVLLDGLKTSAEDYNCAFLKIEPNIPQGSLEAEKVFKERELLKSQKEIFARHTLYLDLTKTEEELLASMHEKWRYNIRLSQKKGVVVEEKKDTDSLENFVYLQKQTAQRARFFVHTDQYYRNLWLTLQPAGLAYLLTASYQKQTLASWLLFCFGKTLYYPYGASSEEHRELMPSHALMWEAIRLGKRLGCTKFDLWGAAGPEAGANDPWQGFTRFKMGFGPSLVSLLGTYDLVIETGWYKALNLADKARWVWLKLKSRV